MPKNNRSLGGDIIDGLRNAISYARAAMPLSTSPCAPAYQREGCARAPPARRARSRPIDDHRSRAGCGPQSVGRSLTTYPFQLPASGENIEPARLADETRHRAAHDLLKRPPPAPARASQRESRARIQRNQIHFAIQIRQQFHHAPRIGIGIVHAPEQHIFKRQLLPRPQRIRAAGLDQILQMPLARDRHQFLPLLFGRCIQRNRQFRPHLGLAPVPRSSE